MIASETTELRDRFGSGAIAAKFHFSVELIFGDCLQFLRRFCPSEFG